jgi:hypothetical protein
MALSPVTVFPVQATYVAQQLNTYTDMADVLAYLLGLPDGGYTGNISAAATNDWQLWFQSSNQNASWNAKLGDWVIVKNGTIASSFNNTVTTQNYTTTPPA